MVLFTESVTKGVEKTAARNVFRTRLISVGQGSSGLYEADTLKRDMAVALPKGTKVYFDHMSQEEFESGRARKMDGLIGVFEDDPVFNEETGESHTNIRIYENSPRFHNVPEFIEEALKDIGVSIEVHAGVKDENGVVKELGYSPHNSLAIVTTPGARGRIEGLMESFRTAEEPNNEEARNTMDKAEFLEALEGLKTSLIEALKPAPEEKDAPSLEVVAEAVATAELTPEGRKAVYAAVESGVAVETAVQTEKTRETAIFEALKSKAENEGGFRLDESGKTDLNALYEAGVK